MFDLSLSRPRALSGAAVLRFLMESPRASSSILRAGGRVGATSGRILHHVSRPMFRASDPALQSLRKLRDGWDGAGAPAPSEASIYWAGEFLDAARAAGLRPVHIMACVDGGVTLHFGGKKSVTVECFNSGEVVMASSAGPGTTSVAEFEQGFESVSEVVEAAGVYLS